MSTNVFLQILRGCLPLSLALLFLRLVWLGLARKYKFTCLFAVAQVCISIWLIYQFPNVLTVDYTWAWTLTRWPIMALLIGSALEVYKHISSHRGKPKQFARLALLLLPGTTATFAAVMLWQCFAVEWSSPYLIVRFFQITCLVYSSVFFAVVFFLIVVRLFVAQSRPFRPNVATSWTFLTLYLTVESVMIFFMNVLNREENVNIGYMGTPLAVAIIVAWSLSLSNEGQYSESRITRPEFSAGNHRDNVQSLRLFSFWSMPRAVATPLSNFSAAAIQSLFVFLHRMHDFHARASASLTRFPRHASHTRDS
jgi:hypothetical protein